MDRQTDIQMDRQTKRETDTLVEAKKDCSLCTHLIMHAMDDRLQFEIIES